MGYSYTYEGSVTIVPPLNEAEINYLDEYADEDYDDSVMPSRRCDWVPSEDGTSLIWNGAEKSTEAQGWVQHLIDTFLKPGATAQRSRYRRPFTGFTFNHVLNGTVSVQGEAHGDSWNLVVTDNKVMYEPR